MISCKKDDPMPCTETCQATPFTSGFKTNLVGKWRFYKIAWFYQNGTLKEYKDTIELGNSYQLEIHSNGNIDFYRNDSLLETRKITVTYDSEGNPPLEPFGVVTGWLDCQPDGEPFIYDFASILTTEDTMAISYRPFKIIDDIAGEYSGRGYYYRKH